MTVEKHLTLYMSNSKDDFQTKVYFQTKNIHTQKYFWNKMPSFIALQ